jgi:hypothetical protein
MFSHRRGRTVTRSIGARTRVVSSVNPRALGTGDLREIGIAIAAADAAVRQPDAGGETVTRVARGRARYNAMTSNAKLKSPCDSIAAPSDFVF